MIKLFIATPAFSGKVNIQYAISLSDTVLLLKENRIQTMILLSKSGSLLCAERNRLIAQFLKSDCTHLLCIDSDLGWPPNAVLEMIRKNKDFIAGVYPCRTEKVFLFRPIYNENKSLKNEDELLEMENIPAGFMLIKREVILKVISDTPELAYCPKENKEDAAHGVFETKIRNGEFWGEDFIFCEKVRNSGFKILVDPLIEFDHDGSCGMLMQTLTDKSPEEQSENLKKMQNDSMKKQEATSCSLQPS
jgi:hypothetical protein